MTNVMYKNQFVSVTTHGIGNRHVLVNLRLFFGVFLFLCHCVVIQLRVRMFQEFVVAEHNGHNCMGACILYGMHAATLCSVHHPSGLRKICGKFCKIYHERHAEVWCDWF